MEFDVPATMSSQWECAEYEPRNVHIYEKEFHDYVVYYVVHRDSQVFLDGLQYVSSTGNCVIGMIDAGDGAGWGGVEG